MSSLSTIEIFEHLIRIEKELTELRQVLLKSHGPELAKRQPGSLRGIWRGIVLDKEDFVDAQASLFPDKDF